MLQNLRLRVSPRDYETLKSEGPASSPGLPAGEPAGIRTQDTRIKSPKQRLPPPSLSVRKWLHNGVFASGRFPQHPPMCAIFREIGTPLAHLFWRLTAAPAGPLPPINAAADQARPGATGAF